MNIWVDADACPKAIKQILFKAAQRLQIKLRLVANHSMVIPNSPLISLQLVPQGFDQADQYIVDQLQAGDLLISNDIPLAADAIQKDAYVINTRGQNYTRDNIAQRLQVRNMLEEMRSSGQLQANSGPAPLAAADIRQFANAFDRLVTRLNTA